MHARLLASAALLAAALPAQLTWNIRELTDGPAATIAGYVVTTEQPPGLLFFGGEPIPETWRYADGVWTRLTPNHQPPSRRFGAMAYDRARDEVVLFGGIDWSGLPRYLEDTWVWDGTDWTERQPAHRPSQRSGAAMAFVEQTGELALFGGEFGPLDDTWLWDGNDWRQAPTNVAPPGRYGHSMTASPRDGAVLHGGRDAFGQLGDTWRFDGTDWRRISTVENPPNRQFTVFAWDSDRQRYFAHGGTAGLLLSDETWELAAQGWRQVAIGQARPRVGGYGGYDPVARELVVFGDEFGPGDRPTGRRILATLAPTVRARTDQLPGNGCGGMPPVRFSGPPILGDQTFAVFAPFPVPGQSIPNTLLYSAGIRTTPLPLGPCALQLADPLIVSAPLPVPRSVFNLPIPDDPALRGATIHLQLLGQERLAGSGFQGLGLSPAHVMTLGD